MKTGQEVEWVTRPTSDGYLHGLVIKVGARKVGIAVQSPKTGEWKPKWAEPAYLRVIQEGSHDKQTFDRPSGLPRLWCVIATYTPDSYRTVRGH